MDVMALLTKHMKPKSRKPLAIFIWIVVPIIAFCFFMTFSGRATVSIHGFAVDSSDNLYIGKERKIEVYQENRIINSIPIQYTDYVFTIKKGQEIIFSADNYTHYLDLQGNEFKKEKDTHTYSALCQINKFDSENGDIYTKSNLFGYTRIIRNNSEVVYSMPKFDYIILILIVLAFGSMVVFVPIFLIKNLIYWAQSQSNET